MKIGVAILTCNREEFFKRLVASLPPLETLVIINDGKPYKNSTYPEGSIEIQHGRNIGIAASKNEALRMLLAKGGEHLFLLEDDILIKRHDVFEQYIKTASKTGIWHLNYALHGSYNRDDNNNAVVKNTIDYGDGIEAAFYHNILGAFSYYLKGVIKNVGYMDERYHNAFEHVDHTYRIIQKGLHPPFWWFADIANSQDYIEDQTKNYEGSVIREDKDFQKNFQEAMVWFKHKHGFIPQRVPETKEEEVLKQLEELQKNYARPVGKV